MASTVFLCSVYLGYNIIGSYGTVIIIDTSLMQKSNLIIHLININIWHNCVGKIQVAKADLS